MKAAICLSGHLRSYDLAIDSLSNLVNKLKEKFNEVDVFLSTWNEREAVWSWAEAHGLVSPKEPINEKIISLFNPRSFSIYDDNFYSSEFSPLKQNLIDIKPIQQDVRTHYNGISNLTKMLWLQYQCLALKKEHEFKNNQKYDIVFKSRPQAVYDIGFVESISFEKLLTENPDGNFVCANIMTLDKPFPAIKDKGVFGGNLGIDRYMSAFAHLQRLYLNDWPSGEVAHAETLLELGVKIINIPEFVGLTNNSSPGFIR